MSMWYHVFSCTACDYRGDSTVLWGPHSYECLSGLVPVERELGWCRTCHLSAVEVLPSTAKVRQLEKCKGAKRSWLGKLFGLQPSTAECDLENERRRLDALEGRHAAAKCLFCGREDWLPFPNGFQPSGTSRAPGPAVPIGMNHPGCGGALQVAYSDHWLEIPLPHRIFNLEGNLLRPEKSRTMPWENVELVIIRRRDATLSSGETRDEYPPKSGATPAARGAAMEAENEAESEGPGRK